MDLFFLLEYDAQMRPLCHGVSGEACLLKKHYDQHPLKLERHPFGLSGSAHYTEQEQSMQVLVLDTLLLLTELCMNDKTTQS